MGFWLQLKLLLWKNYTLRKRHWIRLLIEVLWPLFLFIILMLVRLRGLRKDHHQCHFDEKAMPSAGLVTFTRSFICTFNNTCHSSPRKDISAAHAYNDTFLTQLVSDVEVALERNFNAERVDALDKIISDFRTLSKMSDNLKKQVANGQGIQGLNIDQVRNVIKDPGQFTSELISWAGSKGIGLRDAVVWSFLGARLKPENVAPAQIVEMITDPRTAICDPHVIARLVEPTNMTTTEVQESLRPLCNLSLNDGRELLGILERNIDWAQVQKELEEFALANGDGPLSVSDWKVLFDASEDIRADLLEKASVKKVIGDISDLMRSMSHELTLELGNDTMATGANESLFMRNVSTGSRLAFAAFQRVVCGRNMSSNQLFSDGGEATAFDELRDQLKEMDEEVAYLYDNTTSKECNALMESLEANKLTGFLWEQLKPFIRGKILYTPDTPATRRLVSAVNNTFSPIEGVRRLAASWIDTYSGRIKGLFLDKENQQVIKNFFTSRADGNYLDLLLESNLTKALNEQGATPLLNRTALRLMFDDYFSGENYSRSWDDTFTAVDHFMRNVSTYLSCFDFDKFVPVDNESHMEVEGIRLIGENKLWAGLVFVDFPRDAASDRLPELVRYKLRLDSDKVDSTRYIEDRLPRPGPRRRPGIDLKYLYYGFAYLQDMLEHSIIAVQSGRNKSSLPGITLQQMPYPCYIEDRFILAIARTFPLFMTLAWVYSASMIVKSIVYEKEERLKETMRVMGLGNGVHWAAWFIDSFAVMAFSAFLLTIILTYGDILSKSDPTVTFVFMLSYTVSTISLCFFLSTLFSRANIAAAAGGILFFCFYLPYSFMVVWEEQLSDVIKTASCVISNIAFGFGCAYLAHFEESGVGAQWSNIWHSPAADDRFSLAGAIFMLWVDSAICGAFAWYIEAVWPGEFGVPKPWYFFVTKSYWITSSRSGDYTLPVLADDVESDLGLTELSRNVEPGPANLPAGVSVRHLSKVYSNGKVAVEDLSLDFYQGQITSFLGHNGAGKTTTISILTGLYTPSAGTALINGYDIRTDMDSIRQSLGVCPQHNVLFPYLTVWEHLWFYARLKGRSTADVEKEAEAMIEDLGLPHKRDEVSVNLSGGMQRKLSIAAAFVGGSKTVVLDEPTAGVDPYSRRSIWDLLIRYKADRTIILTTHFMDEADLLGDRIAIINSGRLVCVGSSLFLRLRFGSGYYLTLVKEEENDVIKEEDEADATQTMPTDTTRSPIVDLVEASSIVDCSTGPAASTAAGDSGVGASSDELDDTSSVLLSTNGSESIDNDIVIDDEGISDVSKRNGIIINPSRVNEHALNYPTTKLIQRFVPGARLLEEIGSELIYVLPTADDAKAMERFEKLFTELDKYMKQLKIRSYGLSDTTLEEIFLKVASNVSDLDMVRNMMETTASSGEAANVTNRVRSASESSGFRHVFGRKKNTVANDEIDAKANEPRSKYFRGGWSWRKNNDMALATEDKESKKQKAETGQYVFWTHIKALEIKRFHHSKRNRKGIFCEVILPAVFVCLAMLFTLVMPPLEEQRPLELSPWMYPSAGSDAKHNYVFYSNSHPDGDWPRRYEEQLLSRTGMGARCIASTVYPNLRPCSETPVNQTLFRLRPTPAELATLNTKPCSCAIGTQQCPAGAEGTEPPVLQMPSYDYLQKLTGRNISDYLLKTTHEFYKRRYGGFEFGIRNPLAQRNLSQVEEITHRWLKATNLGEPRLDKTMRQLLFGNLEDLALSSSFFDNLRVWFNNQGWAASVAYMNAANNLVLRASLAAAQEDLSNWDGGTPKDPAKYGITVVNHPMNYTKAQLDTEVIRQVSISLLHAICVVFAMSFVPASFVLFHIEERVSKVKHLHFVSGVARHTYWAAAFLWDMSMFIVSATLCVLIFVAFGAEAYISSENFPSLLIIMFLYGFSSIPLMYPSSFVFSVPSSAFVTLSCTNLFVGIITTVTTFVLENFDDAELKYVGSILKEVFLIFPHYCLGRGLIDMATEYNINLIVARFGLMSARSRYSWNFLGKYMVCMVLQGIIFFSLTLAIEFKVWAKITRRFKIFRKQSDRDVESIENQAEGLDEDVLKERLRVLHSGSGSGSDVLSVRALTKRYTAKAKPAVDGLTFGVRRGECFGLLGVNGAGKTTTFQMLTGATDPTNGDALVGGRSILLDLYSVRQSLGYCPQFDALNSLLTAREHLTLYARLRGMGDLEARRVATWGLKRLGLVPYADRCAGTFSGGNKRKLSTAIALVGNPAIVFLDEPTTGMDPASRRFLWNCILEMVRGGQAVVLTSHSMEECEALCTRVGIMVNGRFQCLGSTQHLKNRFGSGYTLTLRCRGQSEDAMARLKARVAADFPQAELKEEHHNQLQFQLPPAAADNNGGLPVIFREMERAKKDEEEALLEDYSITQTTLDEVFIRFASKQKDLVETEETKEDREE